MTSLKGKMRLFAAVASLMTLVTGMAGIFGLKAIDSYVDEQNLETRHHADALLDVSQAHLAYKNQIQYFKNILIRGNDQAKFDQYVADHTRFDQMVTKELDEARARMGKAGLPPDAWREGAEYLVFEAQVIREKR